MHGLICLSSHIHTRLRDNNTNAKWIRICTKLTQIIVFGTKFIFLHSFAENVQDKCGNGSSNKKADKTTIAPFKSSNANLQSLSSRIGLFWKKWKRLNWANFRCPLSTSPQICWIVVHLSSMTSLTIVSMSRTKDRCAESTGFSILWPPPTTQSFVNWPRVIRMPMSLLPIPSWLLWCVVHGLCIHGISWSRRLVARYFWISETTLNLVSTSYKKKIQILNDDFLVRMKIVLISIIDNFSDYD